MDIFQDVNLLQLETRIIISWTFSDYTIIFFTKRFHFCSLISESEWLPYVKYTFLSVLNSICYKKAKKKKNEQQDIYAAGPPPWARDRTLEFSVMWLCDDASEANQFSLPESLKCSHPSLPVL